MQQQIDHPVLGQYQQQVFDDLVEAGHIDLASQGVYGWELPQDIPTMLLMRDVEGKTVLDLGCGWGNTVVIPSMEANACAVFALDITSEHLGPRSPMTKRALQLHYPNLHTLLLPETWWHHPPMIQPTIAGLLKLLDGQPPSASSIDLMTARQVLHFSSPAAMMNVLDLISLVLSNDGLFAAVNFTPYTGYVYSYDDGRTMAAIIAGNEQYGMGESALPAGYLSPGNARVTLADLLRKHEFDGREFLCFDEPTLHGVFNTWAKTRRARNLPVNLRIESSYYFSPHKIARFNKMPISEYAGKENQYFSIRKISVG